MSDTEKLKRARKRIRLLNKQIKILTVKYEQAELSFFDMRNRYQTQCKIKMEFVPEKNAYAFVNGITGKIYICIEEPRKIGELWGK